MIQAVSKTFFHALAGSSSLKRFASHYGLRTEQSFARRFIAGETLDEAIAAARAVERAGMTVTLDLLGESVATSTAADAATREYLSVMEKMVAAGVSRNISLKLTQLGLGLDRSACIDNLRRILEPAQARDFFIRIDMEDSTRTDETLQVFIAALDETGRAGGTGARFGVLSRENGTYILENVPVGTHAVTVQRIRYRPVTVNVTVAAGQTTAFDFRVTREQQGDGVQGSACLRIPSC